MHKFAVFDLDGTLYDAHLGVELLKKLSDMRAIPSVSKEAFDKHYQAWAASTDRTDYYDQHLDVYYDVQLKGAPQEVFQQACESIAQNALQHTYNATYDALRQHKQEGYKIIVISKSPKPAVAAVAKRLGSDYCWGWEFYFENGLYAGQYMYEDGMSDKRRIIEAIMEDHALTLDDSYGYGDSRGDISMLAFVQNPVCINPDRFLLNAAQQNGWQVETITKTYSHVF